MKMTSKNISKSNRAAADYFELLVCQFICHKYKITFSHSKDIKYILNKVLKLPNGNKRILRQNKNFEKIEKRIIEILNFEIKKKGKIIEVEWLGRNFKVKQTTSDVDAKHKKNIYTRFSVKSVGSGKGTLKNLGLKKIENFFNFDFSKENKKMWENLRKYLNDFKSSKKQIKDFCNEKGNEKILHFAKNINGKKFKKKLNKIIFKNFNKADNITKLNFLNLISDNFDKNLYVIIVNEKKVEIYKPNDKFKFNKNIKIEAKNLNKNGFNIFIGESKLYRVQTGCTNGIGISPFCQRYFI